MTMFFNFALQRPTYDIHVFSNILMYNNMSLANLTRALTPDCMEMISKCTWKGSSSRCDSLFQPVQTMEGTCCSFNYYARPVNNFPKKIAYQISKRPYRVTGCGYATGISITLNPVIDDYYGTYLSSYGFRVLVHDAYNYPDENAETKVVTSGRESFVRINPETTYATPNIRTMAINERNCLFYNERKLLSLQRYSFVNCMASCRSKIVYDRCGCIPASLPNNGSFKVCDLREIHCVITFREIFTLGVPIRNETLSVVRTTYEYPCNCLSDCEFNSYPSEITMGMLDKTLVSSKTNIEYEAQQALQPNLLANNSYEMSEQLRLITGYFPNLMVKEFSDSDPRIEKLHNILTSMYNTSTYSLREILYDLAPDCEDFVLRGAIFGKQIDVTKYTEKRVTSVGACCLFNYQRDDYKAITHDLEHVKFESNSLLNSVQFVLRTDIHDAWHIEAVSFAVDLHFFPREDYPAITTTTMGQLKLNMKGVLEVQVQPTLYGASLAIRNYLPELRQCYFMDEGQKIFKLQYYSLDECLLVCRMRSMNHYCGCVSPLLLPEAINASECTIMQLPCIMEWDALFNRQTYFDYIEHSSSIFVTCQDCLPTCTGVDYEIYNNFYYLRNADINTTYDYGLLKGLNSLEPISLLKFYFKTHYSEMTETDIVGDWVMLLSRFGGILSLFYGFSIISAIEVLYYVTAKWFVLWNRALCSLDNDEIQLPIVVDPELPPLYWDELQPKSITYKRIHKFNKPNYK
ncbi:uncharacterized protein [Eurosta solidaginis]|uniref:uncharacterized protein isoform X2 n=1 Tax=Eurosta solidaginis TaxID=178769 RepID=UPI0035307D37